MEPHGTYKDEPKDDKPKDDKPKDDKPKDDKPKDDGDLSDVLTPGGGSLSKDDIKKAKDQVGNWFNNLKDWAQGVGDLAKLVPSGIEAVPTSANALQQYLNNNDPKHPDYRKNDPRSDNYEGPYEPPTDAKWKNEVGQQIKNSIPGWSDMEERAKNSPDGKTQLTNHEITAISNSMKPPYGEGDMRFHTLLNSLPVTGSEYSDDIPGDDAITTFTLDKDGNIDIVTNYRFSDRDDVSSGGPLMKMYVQKYMDIDKGDEGVFPFYDKDGQYDNRTQVGTTHDINMRLRLNINGGNSSTWGARATDVKKFKNSMSNFSLGSMMNSYYPQGKILKESRGLRKVKFVMEDVAAAPAPTTPTNQTTTQQPTESKQTADALAKEYIEKNGPDKTKELIDKTDEYLSAHGAGAEEPPHAQSDVDKETMQQEVESEIDNNDELDPTKKHDNKAALAQAHRINAQIDADWNIEKDLGAVKTDNNLKIALSIASNRIITHHYPPNLINDFVQHLDTNAFLGGGWNQLACPIVDDELGYADDNIYIENGIIKDNTSDTHQQIHHPSLAHQTFFGGVGEGMSQIVIPKDGGVPYLIFKDYNYHNLRSQDPGEIPGGGEPGFGNWYSETMIKIMSGGAHSIGFLTDLFGSFGTSLINPPKSIGPGWPEGIHGSTYTEFRRNLDELPENLQNMIMSHPLYWTDGRYGELFADEQATEDEFVRSYKAIRSLPNGKNLVTNLQDEVYNKPEYSKFRSLWDTYESEWEDRETNEKEIEKLKRQLYYDFNSKYWGGYTDQDPDSPTFNQWIETPEKHFKFYDLSRQEQFELVGVSYPDFVKAEKALGLTSDGERANWRQMLDGVQGLTGLAGKTVEAGDKLREIEKEFFAEFPESRNGGIFRTNNKAEAARWTKMHNKHQSAMTAYMKAWDEWDAAADPVYDTLNSVSDKYHQEYKPNEEAEYAKKKDEFEKQIEKLQNDWEVRENELYGQMEPFYKQMFQEQIKLFHSTYFDKKFDLPSESWEPGSAEPSAYEHDKYEPQGEKINPATGTSATDAAMLAGRRRRRRGLQVASYKPKGRRLQESDLNLSRRQVRMLREIKKPVSSFELLPQKLSKYKPNFKGKYSPQNTPDKTASKESDALVMAGNQKGQTWRTQDKYWSGYETQERMNIIQDRVGHGDLAWQMIVDEARQKNGWKNREIQEQLNQIAHDKGMKEQVPDYESPFGYVIHEQGASTEEELDTVMKDPLVKKVAKRLRTQIDYKDKPSRKGFPDEPPAKQQDGWHPEYGKKYKYDKLDPQSAEAMPPTGNPEIDANVEKAKPKKPRWKHINTESKVDPKVKWEESVDWRQELKEVTKDT